MKEKKFWNSVGNFFIKIGKRNLIIIGSIILIGAAVWLNWIFFSRDAAENDSYTYGDGAGMSTDYGTKLITETVEKTQTEVSADSYISTIKTDRKQTRDQAIDVLNAVISNENADDAVKSQAVAEITQISKEMTAESNIESILVTKGFDKCVAVINGDTANIVVACKSENLIASQLAQINAVVYEQTGIEPVNIKITFKQL